jgi:hypothetical protein
LPWAKGWVYHLGRALVRRLRHTWVGDSFGIVGGLGARGVSQVGAGAGPGAGPGRAPGRASEVGLATDCSRASRLLTLLPPKPREAAIGASLSVDNGRDPRSAGEGLTCSWRCPVATNRSSFQLRSGGAGWCRARDNDRSTSLNMAPHLSVALLWLDFQVVPPASGRRECGPSQQATTHHPDPGLTKPPPPGLPSVAALPMLSAAINLTWVSVLELPRPFVIHFHPRPTSCESQLTRARLPSREIRRVPLPLTPLPFVSFATTDETSPTPVPSFAVRQHAASIPKPSQLCLDNGQPGGPEARMYSRTLPTRREYRTNHVTVCS